MALYKEGGVNPLAGCLPMLVQLPIWFALYRALFDLAQKGVLNEGFLWIPTLAEPHDMSWLWPLPTTPEGWSTAAAFIVLPVLTVISQVVVQKIMSPPSSDSQQAMMSQMMTIMPFMFGFFALQVPQGLVLYWVTSNLFSLVQQYFVNRWQGVPSTPTAEVAAAASAAESSYASKGTKDGKRKRKR